MILSLYKTFQHWSAAGSVWIYSDPHFDDKEMDTVISNRPTAQQQVQSIKKCVGKHDTLIILGDIGNPQYLKQIKGYKVLIAGNHDTNLSALQEYFDEIYEGPLFIGKKILLSHEPILLPYVFNLHGHCHNQSHKDTATSLNLCAEKINYQPVNLGKLIKQGLLSNVQDIHRQTINKATVRKGNRK